MKNQMDLGVFWKREFFILKRAVLDGLFSLVGLLFLSVKILSLFIKDLFLGVRPLIPLEIDDPCSEGHIKEGFFIQRRN